MSNYYFTVERPGIYTTFQDSGYEYLQHFGITTGGVVDNNLFQIANKLLGNEKNETIICADEIHSDLIFESERKHVHLAQTNEYAENNSITLMSPTKTFNMQGLPCGAAIIPNPELRQEFRRNMRGIAAHIGVFAYTAAEAAYKYGEPWYQELMQYLGGNRKLLKEEISRIEGLSLYGPEATYLAWIDCSESGLEDPSDFFINAGVGVHRGEWFGDSQFVRLNFGCPRSRLEEALSRIKKAFSQRN